MSRGELDNLLSRLCDGTIEREDEEALFAALKVNADFRRQYIEYVDLHAVLSSSVTAPSAIHVLPSAKAAASSGAAEVRVSLKRWHYWVPATCAAILLLALMNWGWSGSGNQAAASAAPRVTAISGAVEFGDSAGGFAPLNEVPSEGLVMANGRSILTLGNDARAEITLDGSIIELGADSLLRWGGENGKAFILSKGTLQAQVAKRPAEQPLKFRTPQAEVVVLGTRFTVSATDAGLTAVETEKGLVQVTRLADGQTVRVGAGQYVLAMPETAALQVRTRGPVVDTPRARVKGRAEALIYHGNNTLSALNRPYFSEVDETTLKLEKHVKTDVQSVRIAPTPYLPRAVWLGRDDLAYVFDMDAPAKPVVFPVQQANKWQFAFNGTRLVSAPVISGSLAKVKIWDVPSGVVTAEFNVDLLAPHMDITKDGSAVALGATRSARKLIPARISVWETTGVRRFSLTVPQGNLRGLAFSPDGMLLAAITDTGAVSLWDAKSGLLLREMNASDGWIVPLTRLTFSRDGRRLAAGTEFGQVRVWDTQSGVDVVELRGEGTAISAMSFSPDGTTIAVSYEKSITLWSVPR